MKLITQRDLIRGVAERWREQYRRYPNEQDKQNIQRELDKLDLSRVSAATIAKTIGNKSWTRLECNECGESVLALVEIGQDPDYESSTARICRPCLAKAKKLIR